MSLQSRVRAIAAPAAKASDDNGAPCKRRSKRKSTALPGLLTFRNMRLTVPCTVADMSGSGAKVSLGAATQHQFGDCEHLPGQLTLVLKADHLQVECEVKWRRAGKLGLRFLGPPRPMPKPERLPRG